MRTLTRFLKQPSTWRGITGALTLLGWALSPEQREAIIIAGVAIVVAIDAFSDEDSRAINVKLPPIDLQGKSESPFDERGFNKQSRFEEDDGYISRDALRSKLRVSAEDYPKIYNERRDDDDQPGFNG
jgi:hypothetical protein